MENGGSLLLDKRIQYHEFLEHPFYKMQFSVKRKNVQEFYKCMDNYLWNGVICPSVLIPTAAQIINTKEGIQVRTIIQDIIERTCLNIQYDAINNGTDHCFYNYCGQYIQQFRDLYEDNPENLHEIISLMLYHRGDYGVLMEDILANGLREQIMLLGYEDSFAVVDQPNGKNQPVDVKVVYISNPNYYIDVEVKSIMCGDCIDTMTNQCVDFLHPDGTIKKATNGCYHTHVFALGEEIYKGAHHQFNPFAPVTSDNHNILNKEMVCFDYTGEGEDGILKILDVVIGTGAQFLTTTEDGSYHIAVNKNNQKVPVQMTMDRHFDDDYNDYVQNLYMHNKHLIDTAHQFVLEKEEKELQKLEDSLHNIEMKCYRKIMEVDDAYKAYNEHPIKKYLRSLMARTNELYKLCYNTEGNQKSKNTIQYIKEQPIYAKYILINGETKDKLLADFECTAKEWKDTVNELHRKIVNK